MRLPKVFGWWQGRSPAAPVLLCTYQVGQRTVELLQLADGHVQWVCNCDDYAASTTHACGAWCKHVAKASAIRSIERLTGARQITRTAAFATRPGQRPAPAAEEAQAPATAAAAARVH